MCSSDLPRLSVVTDNCDMTTAEVGFLTFWVIMRKKKVSTLPRFVILVHLSLKNDFQPFLFYVFERFNIDLFPLKNVFDDVCKE